MNAKMTLLLVPRKGLVAALAACAALALGLPAARAWEVVGGAGLPTFAAGASPGAPALAPFAAFGATPPGSSGFNPGYDFRVGGDFLVGVDTRTGFAASDPVFGFGAGLDASRTSVKLGYDLGRFKPFVTSSFAEIRPAFGGGSFNAVGAPPGVSSPFAPTARARTVGAGFDYSLTDKLSVGVSVSAGQMDPGWAR